MGQCNSSAWPSRFAAIVFSVAALCLCGLVGYLVFGGGSLSAGLTWGVTGAALLTLGALAWAATQPVDLRVNLALAIAVAGGMLLLVEGLVAWWDRPMDRSVVARRASVPFDARSPLQVVRDLRSRGVEAVPLITPNRFLESDGLPSGDSRIFPLAGISRATTVFCNEGGEYSIYRSDVHGFANPESAWKGEIEALLIGDSFTHGACVDADSAIAGHLRRRGRSILNLGMAGTGPLLQLAILREYGLHLNARTVYWIYYEGNDLNDLREEVKSPLLTRYLGSEDYSQNLRFRQAEIDRLLAAVYRHGDSASRSAIAVEEPLSLFRLDRLVDPLSLRALRARVSRLRTAGSWVSHGDELARILELAKASVEASGGRLIFVYLPTYTRLAEAGDHAYLRRAEVLKILRSLEIPLVDGVAAFSGSPDPLSHFPFGIPGHYDASGYRAVADAIATGP